MTAASKQIIGAAESETRARDAGGRVLSIRRLDALDRLRLFKALGAELSLNAPYLGVALLACSVTEIDGVPVPPPRTEAQLEALVKKLGDDGLAVASQALEGDDGVELGTADLGN